MEKSNKSIRNRKNYSIRYIKRIWFAILVLSLSELSGCTKNIADLEFCQIYELIFADYDHDTLETIEQIDRNNLVYDDLCT